MGDEPKSEGIGVVLLLILLAAIVGNVLLQVFAQTGGAA